MAQLPPELKKRLDSLAPPVQQAILDTDIRSALTEISKKYDLLLDQVSALENETLFVMIGLEEGKDFVDNIEREVGVDAANAISIANEIETSVFEQVRQNIRKQTGHTTNDKASEERDAILKEIEKPTAQESTFTPRSNPPAGGGAIETQKERISLEDIRAAHMSPNGEMAGGVRVSLGIPDDYKTFEPKSMAETKLSEPTSNPHKTIDQSEKAKEEVKRNYPEDSDPYREPIA